MTAVVDMHKLIISIDVRHVYFFVIFQYSLILSFSFL